MSRAIFIGLAVIVVGTGAGLSQVPTTMSYQGVLTDASGVPVSDGSHSLIFDLYSASSGGSSLWSETQPSVTTTNGVLSVVLGSVTPLSLSFDQPLWLGISVDGGAELSPRVELTSSPYSLTAKEVVDDAITSAKIADGAVTSADIADGTVTSADVASGQLVMSVNSLTDAVTLAAGSNVTITPAGNTLTIAASASAANSLDMAYDQGGVGAGRSITADAGAVDIAGTDGLTVAGDVGIGMNAPAARLEIKGAGTSSATSSMMIRDSAGQQLMTVRDDGSMALGPSAPVAGIRVMVKASGFNVNDLILQKHDATTQIVRIGEDGSGSGVVSIVDATSNSPNHWLSGTDGSHSYMAFFANSRVGFGTNTPNAKIDVENGGVLFHGTTGGTPVSGAGTRLMWIPAKSAFRAGLVTGAEWDDANIGTASTVGGGEDNQVAGNWSTVAGGINNSAAMNQSTIAGGTTNATSGGGINGTIGGGNNNTVSAGGATVAGGSTNTASATNATVAGGNTNMASGVYGAIGGGRNNTASASDATVGGGNGNTATTISSAIAGGLTNNVTDNYSTIGGGQSNQAGDNAGTTGDATHATVGGGSTNTAGGAQATVAGGVNNNAIASFATVGGGINNTANGGSATVPGGADNNAAGSYSFAAGRRAKANHAGAFVWGDQTAADFASTAADQFLIRASGGVGIGTTAPLHTLHVAGGDIYQPYPGASSTDGYRLSLGNFDGYIWRNQTGAFTNAMVLSTNYELTDGGVDLIPNAGAATTAITMGASGTMDFRTGAINTAPTERMTITIGGNVGIGTATPTALLEVAGDLLVGGPTASNKAVYSSANAHLRLLSGNSGGGALLFQAGTPGAPTEHMRIDGATGNVGIGNAGPTEKLIVAGNIAPGTDNSFTSGTSSLRWSAVWAANGTIQTSDRRLKENIEDSPYGLEEVLALHPVSYTWKDRPGRGYKLGLIAQEVQPVITEVVHVGDDPDETLGLYYSDLIPVLVKAIQEQQGLIERQEHESAELRNELASTKAELRRVANNLGELNAAVRRLERFEQVGVDSRIDEGETAVAMTTTTVDQAERDNDEGR